MIREVLTGYFTSFSSPEILIVIGIVGVFFFQNMKETSLRKMILGESEDSPLVLSFKQVVYGLFGGLVISLIARCLHLEFHLYGEIQMVFLVTIFTLTKLSPYVNVGVNILVIYLVELLMGTSGVLKAEMVSLFLLVGITRLIQGGIIMLDPHFGFTPLLFAKGKTIKGGFRMNKTYLLPISLGFIASSGMVLGQSVFYFLLYPMFSVKETFTGLTKKEAVALSAGLKATCGVIILFLTLGAVFVENLIYIPLILTPLLIQGEVYFFRKIEQRRNPQFLSTGHDVVILDVKRTSMAYLSGLRSGQRVVSLNRKERPTYQELIAQLILATYPRQLDLTVKDVNNRRKTITLVIEENMNLGILFVPPSETFDFHKEKG